MKNKAIVHLMNKSRLNSQAFEADIIAMEDLNEKYGINNVIFYKGDKLDYLNLIRRLEKFGIFTQNYSNKKDLKEKVSEFSKKYQVIYVYTAMELLIKIAIEVKNHLGMPISEKPEIFRNKFLQRDMIQNHNPELGIKFLKSDFDKLDEKVIAKKVGYPFIIKPVDGVQSSGVQKIHSKAEFFDYIKDYHEFQKRLQDRGVDNKELLIEQFIDGNLYSIDYFVNKDQEITISKPVKVLLGVDLKVKDYSNIGRIATKESEEDLKGKRIRTFINSTITACGVRNMCIHHEFKLNSKGQLKTIELNGRFGGGRVDILRRSYNFNIFETIINHDLRAGRLKENNIAFNIYATKRGTLVDFNRKLLERIQKRKSVYTIKLLESFIGQEVGLTKDGFVKMGTISLAHKDYSIIERDYKYIKSKYKQLLILKDENGKIINKIKGYLS